MKQICWGPVSMVMLSCINYILSCSEGLGVWGGVILVTGLCYYGLTHFGHGLNISAVVWVLGYDRIGKTWWEIDLKHLLC